MEFQILHDDNQKLLKTMAQRCGYQCVIEDRQPVKTEEVWVKVTITSENGVDETAVYNWMNVMGFHVRYAHTPGLRGATRDFFCLKKKQGKK